MRFRILFLYFILIYSTKGFAQKWQLSIGPSFPIGNFASSDIYNPNSGLASIGESFEIGYIIKEHNTISFLIKAHAEINPINRNALARQYDQQPSEYSIVFLSNGNPIGSSTIQDPPVTNWSFEKHAWWIAGLSAGVQLQTKEKNNERWYGQGLVGAVYVKSPLVSGSAYNDSTHTGYYQSSASAYGFNYQVKGGIILRSSHRFAWDVGLVFSGSNNITFKNVKANFYYNHYNGNVSQAYAYQYANTVNAKQIISSLQLLIGIRF